MPPLFHTLSTVGSLLLGIALMMLGNSLLGLVVPLKLTDAGFSTELIGVVMAANFAGLLTGSIYGKRLIAEVGHIRAFAGLAAIMAAAVLALPLLFTALSWVLLRFIGGFCIAGLFATMESWLNERASNETRGRVLSSYMIVNYSAMALGQVSINLWGLAGPTAFLVAAMLIVLSLVPVVLTRVTAPDLALIKPLPLIALYRSSPLAVVGAVASGLMLGAHYGMGAVFAKAVGFSVFEVSLYMGTMILGALVLQWPIGRLSDRFDRRSVLLGVLLLAAAVSAGGLASAMAEARLATLLGVILLLGGAMSSVYPIAMAQAYDYLNQDRYVAASSGLLLSYSLGAVAGPIAGALVMGWFGDFALFGFIGSVALLLAGFVLYRMVRRRPLPAARQEPFVDLPRMSPAVAELDPRVEPETAAVAEEHRAAG